MRLNDLIKKVLGNKHACLLSKLDTKLVFKFDDDKLQLKNVSIVFLEYKFVVFYLDPPDKSGDTYTLKRLLSELSIFEKYSGVDFKDAMISIAYDTPVKLSDNKPFTLSGDTLVFNLVRG